MKEITIGDKSLMQISKEDILQLAVMQGCCAHLDFWNYPTLLEYDNTMFSDTVVISYKSTRKEDGIESIPLVFFFCVSDLSYHYHRENVTEKWYGERLKIKAIKFLIEKGGTGYDIEKVLPVEVDRLQPDYSIYNIDSNLSYGFLTRGCPNRCKWCVVPKKEGKISPYMDIEEITAGRKKSYPYG